MDDGIHLPTAAGCLLALAGAMHLAVGVEAFLADETTLAALLVLWEVVALGGVAVTAAGLLPRRPARLGAIALLALSLPPCLVTREPAGQPISGGNSNGANRSLRHEAALAPLARPRCASGRPRSRSHAAG